MARRSVTWLGHGSVLVVDGPARILVDPVLRRRIGHLTRWPDLVSGAVEGFDAVLVTHAHNDHLDLPTLRRLRVGRRPVYAPPNAARVARMAGIRNVRPVARGDRFVVDGATVRVVHAAHDGRRFPIGAPRLDEGSAVGYVIGSPGADVYVAGDTALFDEMRDIGPVEVAMLPIAGWWHRLGPGHMDARAAVDAARMIRPRTIVPIHWGTYRPLFTARQMLPHRHAPMHELRELAAHELPSVHVSVLQPGEALELT